MPREAPDVRETPTGGLLFQVGEEIFSAVGKMMGQTFNNIPESPLRITLRSAPCFASSCSRVVGSISTTAPLAVDGSRIRQSKIRTATSASR